jgi:hypothetical protein
MIRYDDDDLKRIEWLEAKHVLPMVALWIASCAFLYSVSWTANWVYRGFRTSRKGTS